MEEWTKACADKGIPITAALAVQAISTHEGKDPIEQQNYSKEAFTDALVEFIVGDDIVSTIC